ncbi:general substrate transporter [Cadophora sp. MPI-SDFR-AT-0126]|nr:general substrate transporter [Leotiomycetes sp. MPI-SDFR-AT-0126]
MGKAATIGSAVFLAIGGFLFGYDSGIITSTLAQPRFVDYFNKPSDDVQGGVVSSFQGGAILGTIINFFVADKLGRKKSIALGSLIAAFGCALQAGAVSMVMLIIGRFIAGVAVGILSSTVPMYAGEIAEAQHRGVLSGLLQWMLSWGFFVAQWLGYGCSFSDTDLQWRFPLAFQCVPALILLGGIWFLQESPRWLMEQDRHEEALATLHALHDDATGSNSEYVELEFREIRDVIQADRSANKITWSSIFQKASWRRRLFLGCGVQAFGPLSGINVINYYGPRIYETLGINTQESLMIIGISGALSIVYCTIGLWLLDRVGRVKPLIISAAGCALALVVNAALSQHLESASKDQLRAMVAMNFVFSFFYTPTGIISWVYPAEIFPVDIRAKGNSLSTFTNWTLNLVFAQISPKALTNIGFKYFYVFFIFGVIATVCYIFFYPETKGKTLEQMDELFGDQLVPHALSDPLAAEAATGKGNIEHVEVERKD